MAIEHGKPGEPLSVRPLSSGLLTTRSSALFKSQDLEVMRLVLQAGKSLPTHSVPGEITVQCLEGSLELVLETGTVLLAAGELVFLGRAAPHGVRAISDCSALVTIALRS
jgi:quercetin dioxygenase-like cupin family protein